MIEKSFLKKYPLFGGLTDTDLEIIVPLLNSERYSRGDIILKEKELNNKVYFIVKGAVEILKQGKSRGETASFERIALLHEGDTFGEMEFIDIQSCAATVRAIKTTEVVTLSNMDLYKIETKNLKTFTLLIMNLARELSRRLRKMDALAASSLCLLKERAENRSAGNPLE
ncbi:MAG: cyclic nucleotide-binding domain-containing protein [Spirochaetota bacterium]